MWTNQGVAFVFVVVVDGFGRETRRRLLLVNEKASENNERKQNATTKRDNLRWRENLMSITLVVSL